VLIRKALDEGLEHNQAAIELRGVERLERGRNVRHARANVRASHLQHGANLLGARVLVQGVEASHRSASDIHVVCLECHLPDVAAANQLDTIQTRGIIALDTTIELAEKARFLVEVDKVSLIHRIARGREVRALQRVHLLDKQVPYHFIRE